MRIRLRAGNEICHSLAGKEGTYGVTKNILVIDDEDMVRINVIGYLEDEGYNVFSAASAEEALLLLKQTPVDLAIVDIRLPRMDGNSLVMEIHKVHSSVKFIIYTGSVNYDLPEELKLIGVSKEDVFKKPILDMKTLVTRIVALL